MMKAKVLRRMTSDDSDSNDLTGNKENIDTNKAAVVIQSRELKHHKYRMDLNSCIEPIRVVPCIFLRIFHHPYSEGYLEDITLSDKIVFCAILGMEQLIFCSRFQGWSNSIFFS